MTTLLLCAIFDIGIHNKFEVVRVPLLSTFMSCITADLSKKAVLQLYSAARVSLFSHAWWYRICYRVLKDIVIVHLTRIASCANNWRRTTQRHASFPVASTLNI